MALAIGSILNGRYRIDALLGQGGFGAVYRSFDISLDKTVALKENMDISEEARRQFIVEARVLARLSHPNLPRVTDHFVITGHGQYLVMDFIEGEDLETKVSRVGKIGEKQAASWIGQVAEALNYLHTQPTPIIHRDVKPANIRITPQDKAVLVDFGLVKLYNPTVKTTVGARAVTPGYSPPEQYGQGSTNIQTDVYALGATLYTLLTGQQPMESVRRLTGGDLATTRELVPDLTLTTSQVVERAMHVNPTNRFQTIEEFRDALVGKTLPSAGALVSTPLPAPRRLSAGAIAGGLIVLALVGALGVGGVIVMAVFNLCPPPGPWPLPPWCPGSQFTWPFSSPTATLEPTELPSATPNPQATQDKIATITQAAFERVSLGPTQTKEAILAITATAVAPFKASATANAKGATKVFGPQEGTLRHRGTVQGERFTAEGVKVMDFIADVAFVTPYDPNVEGHTWDFGFFFRRAASNEYVFIVSSPNFYSLYSSLNSGAQFSTLENSPLLRGILDFTPGAKNKVSLQVRGDKALLFVNDQFVVEAELSAPAINVAGGLGVVTGYLPGNESPGREIQFTGFTVSKLK